MSPTDRELALALAAKMERVEQEGDALAADVKADEKRVREKRARLAKLAQEYADLQRLLERYSPNGAKTPARLQETERQGPTDFILTTLGTTGRMLKRDLIALLARAIEAHQIATQTRDPQKLASSLVGNLIKRERLALGEGDWVMIHPKERSAA